MKKTLKTYLFGASVFALTFSLSATFAEASNVVTKCSSLGYAYDMSYPTNFGSLACPFNPNYERPYQKTTCDSNFYNLSSCPEGAVCASCYSGGYKYAVTSCNSGYELTNDFSCGVETYDCRSQKTKVGDFLYSDFSCSSRDSNPRTDKTLIGVVFDTQYKRAVRPENYVGQEWVDASFVDDNGMQINLELVYVGDYVDGAESLPPKTIFDFDSHMDGLGDSKIIQAYADATNTFNITDTAGSESTGHAPSIGELLRLLRRDTKPVVQNSFNKLGKPELSNFFVYTKGTNEGIWSTSEVIGSPDLAWVGRYTGGINDDEVGSPHPSKDSHTCRIVSIINY